MINVLTNSIDLESVTFNREYDSSIPNAKTGTLLSFIPGLPTLRTV